MIPFLAGATMRVYVAVFGRHAASFHLSRILTAMTYADTLREVVMGADDDEDSDDDSEDDQAMTRAKRRTKRKTRLLSEWSRIARAAWDRPPDGDA